MKAEGEDGEVRRTGLGVLRQRLIIVFLCRRYFPQRLAPSYGELATMQRRFGGLSQRFGFPLLDYYISCAFGCDFCLIRHLGRMYFLPHRALSRSKLDEPSDLVNLTVNCVFFKFMSAFSCPPFCS